ncbi:leukocyte elastase inhibitor A-like isoform X2 [Macrobrachium nipponense]
MIWLSSAILLLGIGGAHLHCFTPSAHVPPLDKNANLSGIVGFGLDLYKQLTLEKPSENFIFSPYSIWAALVMVYFGAAGNTQAQLARGLRLVDKPSAHQLWKGLELLYRQENNAKMSLDVASRAYFDESFALLPCVLTVFPDELRIVNFNNAKTAAGAINDFVRQKTRGLIPSIVQEDLVRSASMVLVNAVYFKGLWEKEFKKPSTQKRDFSVAPGNTVSVDMMSQVADFNYGESSQLGSRILELPYAGRHLSMILLLPNTNGNEASSLARLVRRLSSAALRDALSAGKLESLNVDVLLPKFKFHGELSKNLVNALKKMGIIDVFDENQADLSQFSSKKKLAVTDIIHKAYVDVNEEGTEAAAATAAVLVYKSLQEPPKPVKFHCDRPFVFLIYNRVTNNILFIGDVKNPRNLQS